LHLKKDLLVTRGDFQLPGIEKQRHALQGVIRTSNIVIICTSKKTKNRLMYSPF